MKLVYFLTTFLLFTTSTFSQEKECKPTRLLINEIQEKISTDYVIEHIAKRIADSLQIKNYSSFDEKTFPRELNRDLRKWSGDKHFEFSFSTELFSNNEVKRLQNYGFRKVEILKGNIGYLRLTYFEYPSKAKEIAESSMGFLANTDAIIIDLRENNGGSKAMVQLILSYFFSGESIHLYSIYGRNEQYFHGYSEASISGKSLSDKPLYILQNHRTFSAAELFAFILKDKDRATLIGQKTAGGGHTVKRIEIGSCYEMYLPVGHIVSPDNEKDWEKTGIEPDIMIDSEIFETAYQLALKNKKSLVPVSADSSEVSWEIDRLKSILEPLKLTRDVIQKYPGLYDRRIVTEENGKLYYQGRKGIEPAKMIPITNSVFRFEEVDFFRVQFISDQSGKIIGLKGLYDDGYEDYSERTEL